MRLYKSTAIEWTHLFPFILKGLYWLIILESLVDAVEESKNSRPFHSSPQLQDVQKNQNLPPLPNLSPTSYSHLQHGKGDLASEAQTLYDLRGYHIPLGGAEETQTYLRQQTQTSSSNSRQSPFLFPSYFQTQNLPQPYHLQNQQQQPQQPSHPFHGQQNFKTQSESPISSNFNFRPSQLDLGRSTTEDIFKPFTPKNLIQQKQEQGNLHQSQNSQHEPYIYVYDDADYEVDVSKTPIQTTHQDGRKEGNKAARIPSAAAVRLETTTHPPPTAHYEFFEEEQQDQSNDFYHSGLPNNNLPFNRFVDDHSQSGSFIPGRHYTNEGPRIEINPSSERKPPPNTRNTVPAILTKEIKKYNQRDDHKIQLPVFDDGPLSRPTFEENPRNPTNRPPFEENQKPSNRPVFEEFPPPIRQRNHHQRLTPQFNQPQLFNQPFHFQSPPTNEREIQNILNNGPKKSRSQNIKASSRPLQIIEQFTEDGEQYDPVLTQKLTHLQRDLFQPTQKRRPEILPNLQNPEDYGTRDTYEVANGNIILEEVELPMTSSTSTTTMKTTTTSTTPPPTTKRVTLKPRSRFPFPPFTGRFSTSSTTSTTTTLPPRVRMTRPRLRPKTTTTTTESPTTTTTTTTPQPTPIEPEYYDFVEPQQLHGPQHNSVEQELQQEQFNKENQEVTYTHVENEPGKTPAQNSASLFNQAVRGRYRHQNFERERENLQQHHQPAAFRPNNLVHDNQHFSQPSPTPTVEQQIYEETPSIQVRTRTRILNPTPTVVPHIYEETPSIQVKPRGRVVNPTPTVEQQLYEETPSIQVKPRGRVVNPTPTVEQQLYEETPSIQVKPRGRVVNPTPTVEQQLYEETPSIQVKPRGRVVNPTPTVEQQIYEETPSIQVKPRERFVNPIPTVELHLYEETPSIQLKPRGRVVNPTPTHTTVFKPPTNQRQPNVNRFLDRPSHPPPRQQPGHALHFIPDFAPFPEPPRQPSFQIPRGRKQPSGHVRLHPQHHVRIGGKPLYISGKMLEKEGGLYAGYEVQSQHHSYGHGLPLPFLPIPNPPTLPPVEPSRQSLPRRPHHEFSRQRERERNGQAHQPRPTQIHLLELRRPTPTMAHFHPRPETVNNVIPFRTEEEIELPKPRARLRLSSTTAGRRRKPKSDVVNEPHHQGQQGHHAPEEPQIIPTTATSNSVIIAENEAKYEPLSLVIHEEFTPTPTPFINAPHETSPPSLEIEVPQKPNPLKRRPLQRIRIPGTLGTHGISQSTKTTTEIPLSISSTTTMKPQTKLRPRPRLMRPLKEIEQVDVIPPTVSQSVKFFRKPTQAYGKFSSRYREEDVIFVTPPPTLPTIAVEESQTPLASLAPLPPLVAKPRPIIHTKKKQKVLTETPTPTTTRLDVTENFSSSIPTSIFLTPKDVLQNRKPARRIPPGSVSDRLKVLQDRRRKLFKSRIIKPSTPQRQEEAFDQVDDQDGDGSVPTKREIRIDRNRNTFQELRKSGRNSSETTSEEIVKVLGIPKPVTTPIESETEFHLLWEEVGSTSVPPPLSSSSQQLRGKTGISAPIIQFNASLRDEKHPITTSESPFHIFKVSNEDSALSMGTSQLFQSIPILSRSSSNESSASLHKNWHFKL